MGSGHPDGSERNPQDRRCAANGNSSLQKQQRPSLCPDELSCDASSALSPVGSADYRAMAGNLIPANAGAALSSTSHQLNTTSSRLLAEYLSKQKWVKEQSVLAAFRVR